MSKQMTDPAEAVLRVVENKAFYKSRFEAQVCGLYPSINPATQGRVASHHYLNSLLLSIPPDYAERTTQILARKLVDVEVNCPTPSEVRALAAQSALEAMGLSFNGLYQRAKHFLAIPPASSEIAGRWVEQLIYTTILYLTRERFGTTSESEWRAALTEVIFSADMPMMTYQVMSPTPAVVAEKRDFRSLIKKNDDC
jgi:hypothetical protein